VLACPGLMPTCATRDEVVIEALASELRATELSLAQWRAHATKLHAQLRAFRSTPSETMGAPRVLASTTLRSGLNIPTGGRLLEMSTSSRQSSMSLASLRSAPPRLARSAAPPPPTPNLPNFLTREFWDPKEALATQRRGDAAMLIQRSTRGFLQRRRYHSSTRFFAIVNGAEELRSAGKSVPAYTLTVVRGGRCWQVSHRFSDWLELDRQLAKTLPEDCERPALPARYPFRSSRIVAYRQFSLNSYLQQLLPLVQHIVQARRILLNFLSRSHLHWLYADTFLAAPTGHSEAPGSAGATYADVRGVDAYDASTGRSCVSSLVSIPSGRQLAAPRSQGAVDVRALG